MKNIMKGVRTYKTMIAIAFAFAFLAHALLHASITPAFAQNTNKEWVKEIHKTFHPVVLVKHLKVKPFNYQLIKKYDPNRALGKPVLPLIVRTAQQQSYCCQKYKTGASLLQFICVLLI